MFSLSSSDNVAHCQVTLPQSKSILNRLLVIGYLSGCESQALNLSEASDVVIMQDLLQKIRKADISGEKLTLIDVGNAGTVLRFLTALLSITPGKWLVSGSERMRNRPIKPLTVVLSTLGAEIRFESEDGTLPFQITGKQDLCGGRVTADSGISSQFISALMMIAPVLKGGLEIELQGDIISGSYILMTQALMQKCGVGVKFNGKSLKIKEGKYSCFDFKALAEPDWSAAAFWFEVAALAPNAHILLRNLRKQSVQGDSVLTEIFSNFGVNSSFTQEGLLLTKSGMPPVKEFDYDFTKCPDLAQAVIVTCAALQIKSKFSGLNTLRIKETDRIEALKTELTKFGYTIEVFENQIFLNNRAEVVKNQNQAIIVKCFDDHRMAMSFAPLALLHESVRFDDHLVVNKSYPGFWNDLRNAGFLAG